NSASAWAACWRRCSVMTLATGRAMSSGVFRRCPKRLCIPWWRTSPKRHEKRDPRVPFAGGISRRSENALRHHGIGHLDEAGHVGAVDVAHRAISARAVLETGGVDTLHDHQEAVVHLFGRPVQAHGVL